MREHVHAETVSAKRHSYSLRRPMILDHHAHRFGRSATLRAKVARAAHRLARASHLASRLAPRARAHVAPFRIASPRRRRAHEALSRAPRR
jgi:hypothetical protein